MINLLSNKSLKRIVDSEMTSLLQSVIESS